jgi:hypothetical protein
LKPSTIVIASLTFIAVFLAFSGFAFGPDGVFANYNVAADSGYEGVYANITSLTGTTDTIKSNTLGTSGTSSSSVASVDNAYATATLPFKVIDTLNSMLSVFWAQLNLPGQILAILITILVVGLAFTLISAVMRYVL